MSVIEMHPGVLFNDSHIRHGVGLVQNRNDGRGEGARVGALAALHSNQFVMAVCIWTKVITIRDEGLHLYPGSGGKLQSGGGRWACCRGNKKQMRMDGATEVRGGRFKCSKRLAPLVHWPGELVYAWIPYVPCRAVQYVLWLSRTRSSFCSPFCPFRSRFLLHWYPLLGTPFSSLSLTSKTPHLFSSASCLSLPDTWPGVSMRAIL